MPSITEAQQEIHRLAERDHALESVAIVAVETDAGAGLCRAVIVSQGGVTAGALLAPADWADPPGDYRVLPMPVDQVGWQLYQVLTDAGVTDISCRAERG